jgi:YD repeat-containing protein
MKKIILIFCLLGCGNLFGQKLQSNYQNIAPSSADVASFAKCVDAPMNISNGLPQISIPIYTISSGNIQMPINLNYNSSGIKVEEAASFVGLGWNLNSGPSLVRSVRGLPDDRSNGYMYSSYLDQIDQVYNMYLTADDATLLNYDFEIKNLKHDLEPDIFTFNALGYSGSFFWNQNDAKFELSPYQNVKIEFENSLPTRFNTNTPIKSFTITLPNGVKCYFGGAANNVEIVGYQKNYKIVDNAFMGETNSPIQDYISSWAIAKLQDYTNHEIVFQYSNVLTSSIEFGRGEEIKDNGERVFANHLINVPYMSTKSNYIQNFRKPNLNEIVFNNGVIILNRSLIQREDASSFALDNIEIIDNNLVIKKTIKFDYFYTISSDVTDLYGLNFFRFEAQKRLFLNSIQEFVGTKSLPPYIFKYNSTLLPNRLSASQDYWGYYNGKSNGNFLFPKIRQYKHHLAFANGLNINYNFDGANRNVDEGFCQAGMLNKIIYPSSNFTDFFYESNTILKNLYKEKIGFIEPNLVDKMFMFRIPEFGNIANVTQPIYPFNIEDTFSIIDPATTIVCNSLLPSPCTQIVNVTNCLIELKIVNITNPSMLPTTISQNGTFVLSLTPGFYKVIATIKGVGANGDIVPSFDFKINWSDHTESINYTVGGVRVSKIILNDNIGNTITKTYDYNSFSNPSESSGILGGVPTHITNKYNLRKGEYFGSYFTASSATPLSNDGQTVKYQNVTEYYNSDKSSFKTEYDFFVDYNLFDLLIGRQDGTPAQLNNWRNNTLRNKKTFLKLPSSNYQILSEDFYSHIPFGRTDRMCGLKSELIVPYYFGSEWFLPNSSTSINYSYPNGVQQALTTSTQSFYNNQHQLSQTSTINSKGETIENFMYYPHDYDNAAGNNIDILKSKNLINLPIKQLVVKNGKLISGSITTYNANGQPTDIYSYQNNSLVAPATHNTNSLLQPNYILQQHATYDAKANLVEQQKTNNISEVYLYGYNHQYPIAKIVGSNYAIVSSYVDQAILDKADGTIARDLDLVTELNKLRAALQASNAFITTYTYKPLVGIATETDTNNKTTFYEYDDFGRLKCARDQNKNIIKVYDYQYQAPINY